jgi:REP element-mobilizing transposase RayT
MTRPRQVIPRQFHLVTRRCTQRQFLLRPDDEINNAIAYCLADAAKRFEIDVLLTTVESNHHHTVIFDRHGRFPEFIEHFHKMVAKCVNTVRGRRENLWASGAACVTRLLDNETVLAKLAYTAGNPVKDLLVDRATQWPGLNGYRHLINGKPLRARRPRFFFRADRSWPEELTLTFVIPPELGEPDEVIAELETLVTALEEETRQLRRKSGAQVLGRKTILQQCWTASPDTIEPPRTLRPCFAGRRAARKDALREYNAFLAAYRDAFEEWRHGNPCVFPAGTYWLARFTPIGGGSK